MLGATDCVCVCVCVSVCVCLCLCGVCLCGCVAIYLRRVRYFGITSHGDRNQLVQHDVFSWKLTLPTSSKYELEQARQQEDQARRKRWKETRTSHMEYADQEHFMHASITKLMQLQEGQEFLGWVLPFLLVQPLQPASNQHEHSQPPYMYLIKFSINMLSWRPRAAFWYYTERFQIFHLALWSTFISFIFVLFWANTDKTQPFVRNAVEQIWSSSSRAAQRDRRILLYDSCIALNKAVKHIAVDSSFISKFITSHKHCLACCSCDFLI